ncbi:putative bifunctional diguanylate cyclase/phosphodiesterase [Actinoplanes sp. URMC 104]|uniref:putative bifunctional diguanylate cyclase/phosphodiesterase n=1 Tax=Actinoplanes sp. URMC 104 TaxID=3423409 RepID=UPI003F195C3A
MASGGRRPRSREQHGNPAAAPDLWLVMLGAGVAAIAGFFLLPKGGLAQNLVYNAIGVVFGLCMLAGVRLHRPRRPALWYWFAAGQFASVAGDVVWEIYEYVLHQEPFPSPADVFYLGTYPLLAVGLVLLVRDRRGRDLAGLIDAAIVATGLGLVFWVFLLHPVAAAEADSTLAQVIATAYPVADVLLLAILARLFTAAGTRGATGRLLGVAALLLLVADVAYTYMAQYATYDAGDPVDGLWLMSYVVWGVAALHPSMASPGIRHATGRPQVGIRRLTVLTASSLLAPGMLFLPGMTTRPGDWIAAAAGAVVLFLLVALRMSGFVTQVQRQAGQLERLAMQDELTGLGNRRHLETHLRAAWASQPRPSIALLDLNGFKHVNDHLGHQAGDRLLIEVAHRLAGAVGDTAAAFRMGGDEFAVVLPGAGDEPALAVVNRIVEALRQPVRLGEHELLTGAGLGLARGSDTDEPFEALRRADVAMYAAKQSGEESCWYDAGLDRLASEEARVGAELRTALDTGQLRLVYQPIVELPHGRPVAAEALIRWQHPERGLINPDGFVPVAERNGLIVEVGAWALREACRQAARWQAELGPDAPQRVSVNVSARQLVRPGLVGVVAAALADSGLAPGRLTIEVTETAVFDAGPAAATLQALRGIGVGIALDDFGTGHSSLTLLRTVPATVLKVDKSFVDDLTSGRRAVIPIALIEIADGLGMTAVAEGVETAEQAAELYRLGYRFAQGYHFGRPAETLPALRTSSAA